MWVDAEYEHTRRYASLSADGSTAAVVDSKTAMLNLFQRGSLTTSQ
jgi:hypothetical protein